MKFKRLIRFPKTSFFLFGPRGTGKSTCLKDSHPEALRIDLLDWKDFQDYSANPSLLSEKLSGIRNKVVLVDEIQRVPDLLNVVHLLIEEKRGLIFALTGSSTRKLRRPGVNWLGGRATLLHMHPFMASELGGSFSLDDALKRGMLPVVLDSSDPEAALSGYTGLYLREEVMAEGLVRKVGDFSRFLEVMAFSHGAVLNASNIARECGVKRGVVDGYLSVMDDLLLGFRLPVFSRRAKRRVVAHDKFYYFDAGLFRSLRHAGPSDRSEVAEGAALEGLVAQHLRAWADYSNNGARLHYWRTPSGTEVDFVVYGPGVFCAIEVKNASRDANLDMGSLQAFGEDYPEAKRILLYRGKNRLVRKDVLILPVDEFLKALMPGGPVAPEGLK